MLKQHLAVVLHTNGRSQSEAPSVTLLNQASFSYSVIPPIKFYDDFFKISILLYYMSTHFNLSLHCVFEDCTL